MMFSTRAEYGVRVMVALAREAARSDRGVQPASLAQIAEQNGLPFAYLEHLAARLKKAGLVESRRGPRGGYLLARPAGQISMAEIVETLEGQIAPIECISSTGDGEVSCSREADSPLELCPTKILWTRVQGSIVRTLNDMTLAELAETSERLAASAGERLAAQAAGRAVGNASQDTDVDAPLDEQGDRAVAAA